MTVGSRDIDHALMMIEKLNEVACKQQATRHRLYVALVAERTRQRASARTVRKHIWGRARYAAAKALRAHVKESLGSHEHH